MRQHAKIKKEVKNFFFHTKIAGANIFGLK